MSRRRTSPPWKVEQLARNVHRITFTMESRGDEPRVLLRSDCHHDNPDSDNELERKHLDEAKKINAPVVDNGDAFCAMQGRWDKRSSKDHVKPEHQCDDYLDALVTTYADFLKPYAGQFAVFATGNHETSILRHHETNLTSRLCERLRTMTRAKMFEGSYTGWVFITLKRPSKRGPKDKRGGPVQSSVRLWRTHGYGGAAPVTKGVIQTNRRAVYTPDANIIISGHTHQSWSFPIQRQRVTNQGRCYQDEQLHISLPSYKDAYGDGYSYGSWEVEKGMPPVPRGAVWLKLHWDAHDAIVFDVERAR